MAQVASHPQQNGLLTQDLDAPLTDTLPPFADARLTSPNDLLVAIETVRITAERVPSPEVDILPPPLILTRPNQPLVAVETIGIQLLLFTASMRLSVLLRSARGFGCLLRTEREHVLECRVLRGIREMMLFIGT